MQSSAPNIDTLLSLWAQSVSGSDVSAPFKNHEEMHATIDASTLGDVPWECLETRLSEDINEGSPSWMRTAYEVWYRNPDTVISAMLGNPGFNGQFDLRPYVDLNANGTRRWNNVMSGNIAWRNSVSSFILHPPQCLFTRTEKDKIFLSNASLKGAMYCPVILGSDKTTVSVAT